LFSDFKEILIFLTGFQTIFEYQNSLKLSSRSRVVPCRWTDIMKLTVDIYNVANMPKNGKGSYVKMFSQVTDIVSTNVYQIPLPLLQRNKQGSFRAVNSLYYKPTCA